MALFLGSAHVRERGIIIVSAVSVSTACIGLKAISMASILLTRNEKLKHQWRDNENGACRGSFGEIICKSSGIAIDGFH